MIHSSFPAAQFRQRALLLSQHRRFVCWVSIRLLLSTVHNHSTTFPHSQDGGGLGTIDSMSERLDIVLFGIDPTEKIVAVETADREATLFIRQSARRR